MHNLAKMGLIWLLFGLVAASAFAGELSSAEEMQQTENMKEDLFVPWPFRNAPDGDGDGIPDDWDRCPETPLGAMVDDYGCPLDGDRDGVADGIDRCPGTVMGALVDEAGCSFDTDGDGIPDGVDRCAGTPEGFLVDANGCGIDSDGDGVPDGIDLCVNTPAGSEVDKNGCPLVLSAMMVELLDTGMIRSSSITFESSKAALKPASYATLAEVGTTLEQWPELRVEIGGHTDSVGSEELNQTLSEQRATAVKQYLVANYPHIEASQFTVMGYGESKPIASNETAEGRTQNRRVEFVVLNQDTLQREIESRQR